MRTFLAKHFDTCLALSTFSKFNSNDVTKWFKAPTTTIYSGYSECNSKPVNIANLHKINISLTGGIYNYNALKELIWGVKIWFDRLTEIEKSKVQLTYAGHDAEAVKKVMHQFNNFCHINLIGFIPLEKLKEIHESSIANLYINNLEEFFKKDSFFKELKHQCLDCPLKNKIKKQCNSCTHSFYRLNFFTQLKKINQLELIKALNKKNIECNVGSCSEVYREKIFQKLKAYPKKRLPNAKLLGKTSIMFPINSYRPLSKIKKEVFIIKRILKKYF